MIAHDRRRIFVPLARRALGETGVAEPHDRNFEPIAQDTPASSIRSRSAAGDHPVISDDFCLP